MIGFLKACPNIALPKLGINVFTNPSKKIIEPVLIILICSFLMLFGISSRM